MFGASGETLDNVSKTYYDEVGATGKGKGILTNDGYALWDQHRHETGKVGRYDIKKRSTERSST